MIKRDGVLIQLSQMEGKRGGSNRVWREEGIDAYIWARDIGSLHAEFMASGADIAEAPTLRIYGMKGLTVRDLDGHHIVLERMRRDVQKAVSPHELGTGEPATGRKSV